MPIAICLWIVSVLFGGLSAVAAISQIKTEKALPRRLDARRFRTANRRRCLRHWEAAL